MCLIAFHSSLLLMTIYNISINQSGWKRLRTKPGLITLLAFLVKGLFLSYSGNDVLGPLPMPSYLDMYIGVIKLHWTLATDV